MSQPIQTVVGIDVGGEDKGFHAVALQSCNFIAKKESADPAVIVAWCLQQKATVVAVDAPCGWSINRGSRLAERSLKIADKQIYCFSTPTRARALQNKKKFYSWVFNGERLYQLLVQTYPLFNGQRRKGPECIETFPHAVVCAMEGEVVSAENKLTVRREALRSKGCLIGILSNIDYVDAGLCAVAADEFRKNNYQSFGNAEEGFIVIPKTSIKQLSPKSE